MTRVGGIVLAAGASRRAGTVKALATVDGEPLVARATRVLREGGCDEVVVVVGPPHADAVAAATDARRVDNPDPARGMLSSLVRALDDAWGAAVVSLVDHPAVRPDTVAALIAAWRAGDAEVVRPRQGGRSGHPYLVDAGVFPALRAAPLRAGARPVLAARRRLDVDVADPGIHQDLDTAAALARAGARTVTSS